jgi:predicted dehydrogenase
MLKKNIVFFGAGNIVTGYQNNLKNCHLKSLSDNGYYNILGVVDSNIKNAKIFSEYSASEIYEISDLKYLDIDIIAICTPTETHYELINKIISNGIFPKCFFCEKPFTSSLTHAEHTLANLQKNNIGLIIGYQRSFLSNFTDIFSRYKNNEYGNLLTADIKYSKGLLNNGSHALDLLFCLFNDIHLVGFGKSFEDYNDIDLSAEVFFEHKGRSITLTPLNEKSFSIFEVDFIFDKRRFRFTDNCFNLEEYFIQDDANYPGYFSISSKGYTKTNMENALDEMWLEINNMVEDKNFFSIKRAIFPHQIVDKLGSLQ